MSLLFQSVVVTQDGVYQPPRFRLEATLFAMTLLFLAASFLLGRLAPPHALLYLAVLGVPFTFRVLTYRKFGPLGPPSVAIRQGTLVFARPEDSRGALTFALDELQELLVYGRVGRRTYRFVRRDGSMVETVPMWGAGVEACVLQFLQGALPQCVTVAEPQTLFESIRGDAP
ncbi:MAG: hypothetical protein Q8R67_07405 [Rhodoferax sp.]|nr:hypothetical protein [Rhodoferax sp.]MDP3651492.1 hypothetical protein [Rhodoferax sp.]